MGQRYGSGLPGERRAKELYAAVLQTRQVHFGLLFVCWIDVFPNRPNGLLGALIGGAQPLMVGGPPLHSAKIKRGEGAGAPGTRFVAPPVPSPTFPKP